MNLRRCIYIYVHEKLKKSPRRQLKGEAMKYDETWLPRDRSIAYARILSSRLGVLRVDSAPQGLECRIS